MTPTIRLDKSYRPLTVPDHFIAYQTALSTDRLTCDVIFLRQRLGDPTAWEMIRNENAKGAKYLSTSPSVSFSHTLVRAPASVGTTYKMTFKRDTVEDVWVRADDDQWLKLLRMYADETMDPEARE